MLTKYMLLSFLWSRNTIAGLKPRNNLSVLCLFSQPPIFPDITSLSRSERLASLSFGSSCRSACVARLHLALLGFTWFHSAQLRSARIARLALLRSALHPGSLLASLAPVTQLALARISSCCLAHIAQLVSPAKRHLALLDLHHWLA